MLHAPPSQIGDVQQSIQSAEIDKHAVVGDIFHAAGNGRAFHQRIHQSIAFSLGRFLEQRAPAHHHIAALAIQFQNAKFQLAILPRLKIVHRAQFQLRSRQKRTHADIDNQPALDALQNLALDRFVLAVSLVDALPNAPSVRPRMREQNVAVLVLVQPLDFNRLARAKRDCVVPASKNSEAGTNPSNFAANIHDHARVGHGHHSAIENFALRRAGSGVAYCSISFSMPSADLGFGGSGIAIASARGRL